MTDEDRRELILHPRTALTRRQDRARVFGSHVRGYTVDTDDVVTLLRAQRRLSVGLLAVLATPVLALPLLFEFVPSMSTWRPFGLLPLPWLLLGPVVLFSIVIIAVIHERRALAIEERWKASRVSQ